MSVLIVYVVQGLLKDEGKAKFGDAFRTWQKQADTFSIDGHAPVRELWYRASLAWQEILNPEQVRACACVMFFKPRVGSGLLQVQLLVVRISLSAHCTTAMGTPKTRLSTTR
jgi:hypothetical protein